LTNAESKEFEKIIPTIQKCMARNYKELKGGCKMGQLKIKLKSDKVIFKRPYRRSEKEKSEIKKVQKELLEAGLIRISNSKHCSPMFMVKKKDGAFRPVIDYRELNTHTEKMDWPIKRIEDIIHKLREAKYFTVIDAKSGFF
jgi:hypothetical protein